MSRSSGVARMALVLAALSWAGVAGAQTPSPTADEAGAKFDQGLQEMLAGRFATGCPAILESFRLDPRPGTLFTLADCERKWGKTASALARFGEFLAVYDRMPADQKAKQRERANVAANERAALEHSVPLLVVRLPQDAPAGTRVWRDDVELSASVLGSAVAVDPGEHVVRAQLADGRAPADQRVTLAASEQRTLVVDLTVASPAATSPAAPVPASAPMEAPVEPHPADSPRDASSRRPWVYVGGGVAIAALAVAGVTGGVALAEKAKTSPACDSLGRCTTSSAVSAGNEAHTLANVETVALITGGVALAVAIVAWATEPSGHATASNSPRRSKLALAPGGGIGWSFP